MKLNWFEYWIGHCWMSGWQSINHSFRNWADLMTGNWKDYGLMFYDDPYEECNSCFWSYLGDDDTLSKEFLENLMEISDSIDRGEAKLIPLDEDFFERMKELTDGVELDD
jgi:hypothetical protein